MARLIYSAIMSLDGYIADADGNFDWAAPDEEVHAFVNDLERSVGTYLYGRRMYETMRYWETADLVAGRRSVSLDFAQIFGRTAPTVLEIGFGMGETTAAIAASRPDINFLGVEVFRAGVGSLLKRIDAEQLTHVRVIHHDAFEVLRDMKLYKPPGVAETIDWATALGRLGVTRLDERSVVATLGTVLKYREDHQRVEQHGVADIVKQAFERGTRPA